MSASFLDLGVPARMADALAAAGIESPFPVQAITLPDALAGRDLCGRAPTGSGKTLGFGIPMMARVGQATPNRPTGLVLVPTRELAEQVQRAFVPLGRASWRFVQAVYGGSPMAAQIHSLKKGASVVVATPGRLLDLIEQGHCDLSAIEVLVIDEADRMADLGFMPDVRKILEMTPTSRQTMLWSATLDGDVNELIKDFLNDPVRHDLVGEIDHGTVEHRFVVTPAMDRLDASVELMALGLPTIMFVKTRFGVDDVTAALMNAGVRAGSLHGARTQQARQRTLEDFKRGKLQALVATDVAARGIHVDNVDLVIHYDLPDNDKDYLHRSGRTGRAGHDGKVVAFVPPSRVRVARKLVDTLEAEVIWEEAKPMTDRGPRPARPSYAERAGRTDRPSSGDRPSYGDRNDRSSGPGRGDRPAYGDRARTSERGGYQGRNERSGSGDRPSYGDRSASAPRSDRPSYGDRSASAPRSDRPTYGDRNARPSSGDRNARPSYADRNGSARPAYGERSSAPRSDRPSYGDRSASAPRSDRPTYGDRSASAPRSDRPTYGDRSASAPRSDRPTYGDRNARPSYADRNGSARPAYGERSSAPRSDRPTYGDRSASAPSSDRPTYGDRNARPSSGDRPTYGDRNARPSSGDRPTYGDRDRSARSGGDRAPVGRPSGPRPAAGRPSPDRATTGRTGAAGGFRRAGGR